MQQLFSLSLIRKEHDLAASSFGARITASTLSDFYSAIVTAIGTLRGPLHGGANEAAMHLLSQYKSPEEAEKGVCNCRCCVIGLFRLGACYVRQERVSYGIWAQSLQVCDIPLCLAFTLSGRGIHVMQLSNIGLRN